MLRQRAFIEAVLANTKADKVDVISHSKEDVYPLRVHADGFDPGKSPTTGPSDYLKDLSKNSGVEGSSVYNLV